MKALLLVAGLLLAAPAPARKWDTPAKTAQPTAEEFFAEARKLIEEGQWTDARTALENARAMLPEGDPRHVLYYERLAHIAYVREEKAEARRLYTLAIKEANAKDVKDLHAADAFEGLGRCLLDDDKPDYALKFLERAFDLAPTASRRKLIERASGKRRKPAPPAP